MNDLRTPYNRFLAVSPEDNADLPLVGDAACIALYVGGSGDLIVTMPDGVGALFAGVPAGTILPIAVRRVLYSNTTASNIVALYAV